MTTDHVDAASAHRTLTQKLAIERVFSSGVSPLTTEPRTTRTAKITREDGSSVFEMEDVECPESWSQSAVDIAANKYFRKAGVPDGNGGGPERSVFALVGRVAKAIRMAGEKQGYFDAQQAEVFQHELEAILITQRAAFNSPVWFNVGIAEAYGIKGSPTGCWAYDQGSDEILETADSYTRPQGSACFILSIEDDLMDIANEIKREMRLFKFGSGAGSNFSSLRGQGEPLSNGGSSSGMISFLRVLDTAAGAIKSGGASRRAAKMVVVDIDHPDVHQFIDWKVREEEKAVALINAGFSGGMTGEAFTTVSGQNANNSIRLSDAFMKAVVDDREFQTHWRTDPSVTQSHSAKKTFRQIAKAAWSCADPGLMFGDTINSWHTCSNTGQITGSNPCVPGHTLILTRQGYQRIDELVGQTVDVWNGFQWSPVEPRITGRNQPLVRVSLSDGTTLDCTPVHQFVLADGSRVGASELQEGEALAKFDMPLVEGGMAFPRAYEHGIYCGDGSDHENGAIVRLYGEKMRLAEHLTGKFIGNVVNCGETTENRLFRFAAGLPDKFSVPLDTRVEDRLAWLAGLLDTDGTLLHNPHSVMLQVGSVHLEFLRAVRLMLTTLGVRAKVTKARDAGTSLLPDGRGGRREYPTQAAWRLLINSEDTYRLVRLGLRTYRIDLPELRPQRDARRFVTVESVESIGTADVVYCFTEHRNHTGTFAGIVTGQCSEYVFLPNSACNLASLNLVKFERADGSFDIDSFVHTVRIVFIAQEILVDHASYPSREIAQNSHDYRPLGIGYANLGALLMRAGLPYDSDEARRYTSGITALMTGVAYAVSAEMAQVTGPFPGFDCNREPMLAVMNRHRDATRQLQSNRLARFHELISASRKWWDRAVYSGEEFGYRNAQASLLAPTGTISFMMDCDTTGIEPDYQLVKVKAMADGGSLTIVNHSVPVALERLGYAAEQVRAINAYVVEHGNIEGAPHLRPEHLPVFDCAVRCNGGQRFISPMGHLHMMAAAQPFLSGAISKSINVPKDTSVEEIEHLYMQAWHLGIKAIAIYRDQSKAVQVLGGDRKPELAVVPPQRKRLPDKRRGWTQKARVGGHKVYLRTGEYADGSLGEIFIDMARDGASLRSWANSFAMSVSLGLQYGVPLEKYVEMFTFSRFEPSGRVVGHPQVKNALSVIDYVFRVLGIEYLGRDDLGHVTPEQLSDDIVRVVEDGAREAQESVLGEQGRSDAPFCASCGSITVRTGTCYTCTRCGYNEGCA